MRPLHFLQCLAWTLLVVSVITAFSGGLTARWIHASLVSVGDHFSNTMEAAR
jgi:hypothetical protein